MNIQRADIQLQEVTITCIGTIAEQYLRDADQWFIHSLHSRCCYCHDASQNVICLGQHEIGKGPFTLQCMNNTPWPGHLLPSIRSFTRVDDRLISENGQLQFNLQAAEVWANAMSDISHARHRLREDLGWIAGQARQHAPPEGLGGLIPVFLDTEEGMLPENSNAVSHILQQRVLDVVTVIRQRHASLDSWCKADTVNLLQSLIGLGSGLTPSGDDFLAGMVMGLHKLGNHHTASMLAAMILAAARDKTTQVSLAFFQALAREGLSESLYAFLNSVGKDLSTANRNLLADVTEFGATSGWDTIAGISCVLSLEQMTPTTGKYALQEAAC